MKTTPTWLLIALATSAFWIAGCEKKPEVQKEVQRTSSDANDAIKNVAESIKETSVKVAQDVAATSEKVAKDVAARAEELAKPVNSKAQEIIDSTKKLVNDRKIQAALVKWKELAGEKLTAEQKAISDGLKLQIDKLMGTTSPAATNTSKAAGNLIK